MTSGHAKRCREDTGVCTAGGTVLSSHRTSSGVVTYVRCRCGGTRVVVARWSAPVSVSVDSPVGVH